MKKILIILSIVLTFAIPYLSYGADTVTETVAYDAYNKLTIATISWSDDTGNGVSQSLSKNYYNGWVIAVDTDPGTTAPTDNYDIEFTTTTGGDIFENILYNRDTANSERITLSNPVYMPGGTITLSIPDASQDANSGVTTANKIVLYIWKETE